VAAGLLSAIVLGVPAGLALGYWQSLYAYLERPLHALRSVPATALFPLLLIVIGVGETAIVVLATYPSFLIILVNTVGGVRLANDRRVEQARALGLGPAALVTEVLFFEALPGIFNGLRTAVSFTLVLVVAVEMFVGIGQDGLGRAIYEFQTTYRIPEAYAMILVAGLCGIALNATVTLLERRMLHWVPNTRSDFA
jgi:ABC-type nitrate/sulfonate/bicarbonate transport system permease component